MNRAFGILAVLIIASCQALAEDLFRSSLDDVSSLGTVITSDSQVKTEGAASIKIVTKHPTTVCLGEVTDLDVENAVLIYSAQVKSELDGRAYLEMWVHVGEGQYFSRGLNETIDGSTDWKPAQTPFVLQEGQKASKAVLNLVIEGRGTAWVDDVVLSRAASQ